MKKNSVSDIYLIIAASILLASALVWLLAPPDLLKPLWVLGIYKIWIPFAALVIALPFAIFLGSGQATNGFLSRPVRWTLLVIILALALVRVATPAPIVPASLNLDNQETKTLQAKSVGLLPGGVRPPPADIKEPVPTPFPPFIKDVRPGDSQDEKAKGHSAELHEAAQENAGNKKAQNYIAQAAAAAAALYVMSALPPPANALVAKVVGQLLMAIFGDGDLDPGEAMFVGQLIMAAISGDPAQVTAVFDKSDIGMHAIQKVTEKLTKNPDVVKLLKAAGQDDPSKITAVIAKGMQIRGIDPTAIQKKISDKFQGADQARIVDLLVKRLPARNAPAILAAFDDNVKLAETILKSVSEDSLLRNVRERKDLLDVMAKRWAEDATVLKSKVPAIYHDVTGAILTGATTTK